MADWQTQAIASLPHTNAARIGVFAANRFPELTPAEVASRNGVMGDRIFYIDRDGQPKWEEPSFGSAFTNPAQYAASQIGPGFALVGAAGGGLVGGVPGAAAGAGAGDALRQYLAWRYFDEQMSPAERALHLGLESAAGAGGRYVGDKLAAAAAPALTQSARTLGSFASGPLAQFPIRNLANKAVFGASRAVQDRLPDVHANDIPEPAWLGIPW